ncbi:MAG: hypothetical protein N2327_01820 [Caldimicrobium sp.]|nr:hypothetical protein [Caldimicrobium sp.]MCX7873156.1 hypothetical protein [Caldimicrobium sp.]MDW8094266.1 hypothetical protein [Caldimicrobium sp.]
MPLNIKIATSPLKLLHQATLSQRLGEILHFCLGFLLSNKKFKFSDSELLSLIEKALVYHPYLLMDREYFFEEVPKFILVLKSSPIWKELEKLLIKADCIYREIEGYYYPKAKLLRADLVAKYKDSLLLFEFKLKEEDLNLEQIELYIAFLKALFPKPALKVYGVFFNPPNLKLIKELNSKEDHANHSLSNTTQLPLFKNFN